MYADDATFLWKFILRFLAIILAIVAIALTAWAMISHIDGPSGDVESLDSDDFEYDYFPSDYASLPWQYITLGLSIIWNVANIGTLLARNRAIHPGAKVACDLLLWLGLQFTSAYAIVGATNYFFYTADDDSDDDGLGYGGGTYGNATQYNYTTNGTTATANGTTASVTSQCGSFTTCAESNQYASAIQHKGVVIAVAASMALVVLLFHFALFISACRYTNDRRQSVTRRQSRAITAEATEIACRMIADMTGPNGGFIPIDRAQQGGSYQPLQQSEAGEAMEMTQRQSRNQPGYDYQPVQQGGAEADGRGQRLSRGEGM